MRMLKSFDGAEARCLMVADKLAKGQIDEHDAEGALREAAARIKAMVAERDKLHAALAWREKHPRSITMFGAPEYYWTLWFDGSSLREPLSLREHFDGTPAGQAAALVRLWEKVTGGFGTKP